MNEKLKLSWIRKKWRELVTNRPALYEILKGVFHAEMKGSYTITRMHMKK